MLVKVHDRLFIGNDSDCFTHKDGWVTVHACKSPCHQYAVRYKGNLPRDHPNYLIKEDCENLFLNIIDPPQPLFMMPLFTVSLEFIDRNWASGKNILIHCNKGESRSPSIALLFLAKKLGVINSVSYDSAKTDFIKIYPTYNPGSGIKIYLTKHWMEI